MATVDASYDLTPYQTSLNCLAAVRTYGINGVYLYKKTANGQETILLHPRCLAIRVLQIFLDCVTAVMCDYKFRWVINRLNRNAQQCQQVVQALEPHWRYITDRLQEIVDYKNGLQTTLSPQELIQHPLYKTVFTELMAWEETMDKGLYHHWTFDFFISAVADAVHTDLSPSWLKSHHFDPQLLGDLWENSPLALESTMELDEKLEFEKQLPYLEDIEEEEETDSIEIDKLDNGQLEALISAKKKLPHDKICLKLHELSSKAVKTYLYSCKKLDGIDWSKFNAKQLKRLFTRPESSAAKAFFSKLTIQDVNALHSYIPGTALAEVLPRIKGDYKQLALDQIDPKKIPQILLKMNPKQLLDQLSLAQVQKIAPSLRADWMEDSKYKTQLASNVPFDTFSPEEIASLFPSTYMIEDDNQSDRKKDVGKTHEKVVAFFHRIPQPMQIRMLQAIANDLDHRGCLAHLFKAEEMRAFKAHFDITTWGRLFKGKEKIKEKSSF